MNTFFFNFMKQLTLANWKIRNLLIHSLSIHTHTHTHTHTNTELSDLYNKWKLNKIADLS